MKQDFSLVASLIDWLTLNWPLASLSRALTLNLAPGPLQVKPWIKLFILTQTTKVNIIVSHAGRYESNFFFLKRSYGIQSLINSYYVTIFLFYFMATINDPKILLKHSNIFSLLFWGRKDVPVPFFLHGMQSWTCSARTILIENNMWPMFPYFFSWIRSRAFNTKTSFTPKA